MARIALLLLLSSLVLGCEDGTELLAGDASVRDVGPDAGWDGGPGRETGPRDGGPDAGMPNTCAPADAFDVAVLEFPPQRRDYEGRVEIVDITPLVLRGEPGPAGDVPEWRFEAFGAPWPAAMLRVGQSLQARIEIDTPFWVEVQAVLTHPTTGALALAFWTGDFAGSAGVGTRIGYAPQDCTIDEGCGVERGEMLVVNRPNETIAAEVGARVVRDDIVVVNGRSTSHVGQPECLDEPSVWRVGMVAQPTDAVCADLARDDCVFPVGCVLWGSEEDDPGYVCFDAADSCEAIPDFVDCDASPGCQWDPGTCYCPEGQECACGGGPAPKCRTVCDGMAGTACPGTHFCEHPNVTPPMCAPPPDDQGICTRIPLDCDGSPNRMQCACTEALRPETFRNGCERRAARASGPQFGACP